MISRSLRWGTVDGRTITVREMTDIHLANMIARLEIQAERECDLPHALPLAQVRALAAHLFPAYPHLVAERARRIGAQRVRTPSRRLDVN